MSESCGLPNVDIFDPVQCSKRWSQCATQQQINVYLNSEIVRTQECLQLFKTAQAGVNEILDGKIKNHETRIAALESAEAQLKSAQDSLVKQFAEIQAGNTAYQTSVDNTLKLYQASINALTNTTNTLTSEQQKMWNEINALKGSIDPAKIEQALAGYDAIMSQTKALIEQNNTALQVQFKQLETKFATLQSDTLGAIADNESATAKRFNDFARTVNADIEAQNTRLNTFINSTNSAIAKLQSDIASDKANVDAALEGFSAALAKLAEDYKAADCKIEQRIAAEEQARKDGDSRLEGIIKTNEKESTTAIKELQDSVKSDLNTFEQNVDNKLLQINNDIRDRTDKQIDGLDEKLSAKITALEITEAADNKTTNARIDALQKEVGDGVNDRIASAAADLNQRITKVESDAQTANAELETKLQKAIAEGDAKQGQDLTELKALVETQGELITASRDEATLAWEKEVKDRIAGDEFLQKQIDSLGNDVTEAVKKGEEDIAAAIKEASESLDGRITAVEDAVKSVQESDAKQWTTINNTVESQNQLREQVDKMQEVVDKVDTAAVDNLTEREVTALKEQVDGLDVSEDVDSLKETVALHTLQIEAAQDAVKSQGERLEVVEKQIPTLEGRVDKLEDAAKDDSLTKRVAANEISDLITKEDAVEVRVKALEDADGEGYDDTELRAQVESAKSVGNANAESIADLQPAVSKLEADVAKITPDVTKAAVVSSGGAGPQFTDSSGQRVGCSFDGSHVTFTHSDLHHKCVLVEGGGSISKAVSQNSKLTMYGCCKATWLPIKEGYNTYEATIYVENKIMYISMTEKKTSF
ncbi:extracellular matrix-binding protein ebh-like [Bactrocera tryoni]|uniref:extracellular matrix-binding protein ebh-like n=1 Tax=Bactrocera tryoni TaxID=59916 RepID=UPI001A962EBC|nr:extracellular matrix-binding protein ebh-like [Bactrocera tryoni]